VGDAILSVDEVQAAEARRVVEVIKEREADERLFRVLSKTIS
jgi:hypothetical protein